MNRFWLRLGNYRFRFAVLGMLSGRRFWLAVVAVSFGVVTMMLAWPNTKEGQLKGPDILEYVSLAFSIIQDGEFRPAYWGLRYEREKLSQPYADRGLVLLLQGRERWLSLPYGDRVCLRQRWCPQRWLSRPYADREPGYPLYLAAVFATVPTFHTLSFKCLVECVAGNLARLRFEQAAAAMAGLLAATTFIVAYTFVRNWPLSIMAGLLCLVLLPQDSGGNVLIALFLLGHSVLAVRTWHKPRILTGALSGVALGLLTLTEAVFQYWLAGIVLVCLVGLWWDAARRRVLLPAFGALLLAAFVLTLPWMTRNALQTGRFGIAGRSGGEVLAIRAEYGRMTWSELWGAFAYYLPVGGSLRSFAMRRLKPQEFAYTRFDRENPKGFYGLHKRRNGDVARLAELFDLGWRGERMRRDSAKQEAALQLIQEDWLKHIVLTFVFAERGSNFYCRNYGPNQAYGVRLSPGDIETIKTRRDYSVPLARMCLAAQWLSLLFLPALGALLGLTWRRRDLAFLLLPVVYFYGFHALATHFIPRYSEPLAPLFTVILALVMKEIWLWAKSKRDWYEV